MYWRWVYPLPWKAVFLKLKLAKFRVSHSPAFRANGLDAVIILLIIIIYCMTCHFKNLKLSSIIAFTLLLVVASAMAQDGTIYPLAAPAEPNAIALGTGGVKDQPAQESWFRQWGDPMARNITKATLTPFLPKAGKANGMAVIVAPGGGFRWLSMGNEGCGSGSGPGR